MDNYNLPTSKRVVIPKALLPHDRFTLKKNEPDFMHLRIGIVSANGGARWF